MSKSETEQIIERKKHLTSQIRGIDWIVRNRSKGSNGVLSQLDVPSQSNSFVSLNGERGQAFLLAEKKIMEDEISIIDQHLEAMNLIAKGALNNG